MATPVQTDRDRGKGHLDAAADTFGTDGPLRGVDAVRLDGEADELEISRRRFPGQAVHDGGVQVLPFDGRDAEAVLCGGGAGGREAGEGVRDRRVGRRVGI